MTFSAMKSNGWPKCVKVIEFFDSLFHTRNRYTLAYCIYQQRQTEPCNLSIRVDMVGMNHNKVLTQWRHMPMGQFRANIFLIQITSTYFWASEVLKNRSSKSWLFWFSNKKTRSVHNKSILVNLAPKLKWYHFHRV